MRAIALAERITPDNHKAEMRFVKEKVMQDHPALKIARHVVHDLSPACRDGFINAFVVNALLRGSQKRQTFSQRRDMRTPFTVLVSPTMRCNLHCEGCYASEYSHQSDMSGQLFQRIVDEAAEMGVYLITVLGGEPFMRTDLLDVAAANPETYFQVFSNGTLVRPEQVARIAELGNVALMLSIEGDEATTDARRGPGTYRQLLDTMELLKEHGVLFGYSATVTRRNWQTLLSDAFVDPLVARGAAISWHFLYMPVGGAPDVSLMPTPEQRNQIRLGIQRIRNTKAMFPVDFWGDAPWVEGCIAGKHYVHINNEGWVEPCIFTHFATDNIADYHAGRGFQQPLLQADPRPSALQSQPAHALHADRQPRPVARDHGRQRCPTDSRRGREPHHRACVRLSMSTRPTSRVSMALCGARRKPWMIILRRRTSRSWPNARDGSGLGLLGMRQ